MPIIWILGKVNRGRNKYGTVIQDYCVSMASAELARFFRFSSVF